MSRPRLNLIGKKFRRLTVIEFSHTERYGGGSLKTFWKCRCDCGNIVTRCGPLLKYGNFRSCGCLITERMINGSLRSRHPLYHIWHGMIARCYSTSEPTFKWYGARGISVCDSWRNDFKQFCKDVSPRPGLKYSLDRINNNGNYEPGNIRWATDKAQANNTRRNVNLTLNNVTMTTAEWSNFLGLKRGVIHQRIKYGWPIEKVLSSNYQHHKRKTA